MEDQKHDCCDEFLTHDDAIAECLPEQLTESAVNRLSESFKALSDPTRIRMLYNLTKRELCVCDLAEILGISQSAVSHQLRYLRNLRLVKNRREGNTIFYRQDDAHVMGLLQLAIDHIQHTAERN